MCGIVGIAGKSEPGWLARMHGVLTHRGPDDCGEHHDEAACVRLGHRRLSIIDLGGGHQPMPLESAGLWIVFNGEIFNAPELRRELEAVGCEFTSGHSDTEVLLHLYEREGEAMVERLNGMFAFVIHDKRRGLLFGARDPCGIKPLYLWEEGGRFAFASEAKALLRLPCVARETAPASMYHYLSFLYVPGVDSIWCGIRRLPPAHVFRYEMERGELETRAYWRPEFPSGSARTEGALAEDLRGELRGAVKRWSLSDVPVACSLSGGLDSSAVVGLLAEAGAEFSTYTVGFTGEEGADLDERKLARQVAERWGCEHHEIIVEPEDVLDDLVKMVWHLDEPYGGGLPSWQVFRAMGQEVKVGMTGSGGDELFGNYGKFREYEKKPWLRGPLGLREVWQPDGACWPDWLRWPFGTGYHALRRYFTDAEKERLLQEKFEGEPSVALAQRGYDAAPGGMLRDKLAAFDLHGQLAEEFLFMTDRFSMAHGLEARVPFLDPQLMAFVYGISAHQRTRPRDLKYLFKQAVADLLPPDLLTARKRGFVLPLGEWLRGRMRPLVEFLLEPGRLQRQGVFQTSLWEEVAVPHLEGRLDRTGRLWAVVMFQLWHLVYVEEASEEAPTFTWQDVCA